MKIFKEIFLNITDKYRTLITWTLVFVFFFFSMLRTGFLFSLIHALIITGAMAGVRQRFLSVTFCRKGSA